MLRVDPNGGWLTLRGGSIQAPQGPTRPGRAVAVARSVGLALLWLMAALAVMLCTVGLCLALSGCAHAPTPLDVAITAQNASVSVATGGLDILEGVYTAEQKRCVALGERTAAEACSAASSKKYGPAFDAYRDYRAADLALRAAIQAWQAGIAVGQAPDAAKIAGLVADVGRAGAALSVAVQTARGGGP